jgi:hypothetical protein
MKEEIRRFVAYAGAGRSTGQFGRSIYSYDRGQHSSMSKTYDYECGAHLSGADNGRMYHYGLSAHVSLDVDGDAFKGFDYSSGSHFSGRVNGRSVQLYDYGEGRYYNYTV